MRGTRDRRLSCLDSCGTNRRCAVPVPSRACTSARAATRRGRLRGDAARNTPRSGMVDSGPASSEAADMGDSCRARVAYGEGVRSGQRRAGFRPPTLPTRGRESHRIGPRRTYGVRALRERTSAVQRRRAHAACHSSELVSCVSWRPDHPCCHPSRSPPSSGKVSSDDSRLRHRSPPTSPRSCAARSIGSSSRLGTPFVVSDGKRSLAPGSEGLPSSPVSLCRPRDVVAA